MNDEVAFLDQFAQRDWRVRQSGPRARSLNHDCGADNQNGGARNDFKLCRGHMMLDTLLGELL
jgi:hypothetical protein